jgi:hypothetical protein
MLFLGAAWALGRRAVTGWIRAAERSDPFRRKNLVNFGTSASAPRGKRWGRRCCRIPTAMLIKDV